MKHILAISIVCSLCWSLVSSCGRGRRCPPRDTTKPTIRCPPNIRKVADPYQVNTKVYWDEKTITANDNRDGPIRPYRSRGKAPGKLFSGTSRISYTAKDRGGNYATCSFYIIVDVLRCPDMGDIQDGWKICHTNDFRRGSRCRFGCYGGHELVGPSPPVTTCLDTEEWDIPTKPFCQKLQCAKLWPSPQQNGLVEISCTDSNYYRSVCSYNCVDGYKVLPGHGKVRVCDENGHWKGSVPECVDTEQPVFTNCPYGKTGYADRSKTKGTIWWIDPVATDNSGSVTSRQISGPIYGTELEVGEHEVTYMASDAVNNTAFCEFTVVVKQIKCHTIYPLPYTNVVCPNGRIFGSSCEFTCDDGNRLNGSTLTQCDKKGSTYPYGSWTFNDNQPFCELTITCPDIRSPDNGALACDTWLDGLFCQVFCQDMHVLNKEQSHRNLIVCGDSGTWHGLSPMPHCEEVDERAFIALTFGLDYHYEGQCKETSVEIKSMLIEAITKAFGQSICKQPDCSVNNVKIICGIISDDSRRKRRSDSEGSKITVEGDFQIPNNKSSTEKAIARSQIKKDLAVAANDGSLDLEVDGIPLQSPVPRVSTFNGECGTGYGFNERSLQCVKCTIGYFHDNVYNVCSPCARGSYQDIPLQTSCKLCPPGETTKTTGANSASQCEEACNPGFYSSTGTPPCSACDTGFYTNITGSLSCTKCKGSQITLKSGSISESQCSEFDVVYNQLDESEVLEVATLDTQAASLDEFTLTLLVNCSQCDNILSLTCTDNTDLSITHPDTFTVTYNGQSYTPGVDLVEEMMWKQITIVKSSTELVTYIDSEEVLREQVSARRRRSSESHVNITVTIGGEGFIGSISQLGMWSATSAFTPKDTDSCFRTEQGDLIKWSDISEVDGSFVLTQSKCDVDNNCESSPCHNGGACKDAIGSFSCECPRGFKGSFCEVNIDDCRDNSCNNNAICTDGPDEYTCVCTTGFTGQYCETKFVDGGWSEYSAVGDCSVTCGIGVRQMKRFCTNPSPSNGGKACEGSDNNTESCDTEVICVNECDTPTTTLDNGTMNCAKVEDENKHVCKPKCNEGFEFDSDLYNSSGIECGEDTGYVWNIKNDDNPDGLIPSCQPKKPALKLIANTTGKYDTLSTNPSNVATVIKSTVGDKLNTVGCLSNGTCDMNDMYVLSSTDQTGEERKRRETSFVSFSIELSCDNSIGQNNCYDLLAEVITAFNTFVQNLGFTIQYDGDDYDVGVNTTSYDGVAQCEPGYASVWEFCVSCGKGTYETDSYCESCPRGYYQDMQAQTSCKKCPDGWTTAGLMSRDSIFCSVEKSDDSSAISLTLVISLIVVGCAALVVCAIVTIYCLKSGKKNTDASGDTSEDHAMRNANSRFTRRHLNQVNSFSEEMTFRPGDDGHANNIPSYTDSSGNCFHETVFSKGMEATPCFENSSYVDHEKCPHMRPGSSEGAQALSPPPQYKRFAWE